MTQAFTRSPGWDVVIWAGCFVGAFWAGRAERSRRRERWSVVTAAPWTPSHRPTWEAGAAIRVTAWPRARPGGWHAPAVIIGLGDEIQGRADFVPRVGDGILLQGEGPVPALWEIQVGSVTATAPAGPVVWGGYDPARYLAGHALVWQGKWRRGTTPPPQEDSSRQSPEQERTIPSQFSDDATAERDSRAKRVALEGTGGHDPLGAASRYFFKPARQLILESLETGLPPREAALVAAILLGQRDSSSTSLRGTFAHLGLAHLFAVSGLHVGILLAMVNTILARVQPPPRIRSAVLILLLAPYVVLTGMSASVIRASCLAMFVILGPMVGRRPDSLYGLGVLFWLNYQWQPWCVLDTGLRLSFLSATGIVTLHRLTSPLLPERPKFLKWLVAGLLVTLAAQWFTFPEIANSFGWIHLFSPLANLAAIPLFTLAVWLVVLGLILGAVTAGGGQAVLAMSWLLWRLLEAGAGWLATNLPGKLGIPPLGPLRLGGWLLLSALLLVLLRGAGRLGPDWSRQRWGCLVLAAGSAACLLTLIPSGRACPRGQMTAVQFAVGQGDCALLVFPDGWSCLVDTGPGWRRGSALEYQVLPWLTREGIKRLDAVALTHAHADHTGGMESLVRHLPVGCYWLGGLTGNIVTGAPSRRPRITEILHRAGSWTLVSCDTASLDSSLSGENDHSLTLGLAFEDSLVALWSGDLEIAGENRLLELVRLGNHSWPPPRTQGMIWKAGHHGSGTSGSQPFLDYFRPDLALVSCGVENRHHHPSHGPYVVRQDTAKLLRTDVHGSILVRWSATGHAVWHTVLRAGSPSHEGQVPPAGGGE